MHRPSSRSRRDDKPFIRRVYDDLKARTFRVCFERQSLRFRQNTLQ